MNERSEHVVIVGGGWAGLSAALRLSKAGLAVTLLESARQLGGRARRIPYNQHPVDNGQHLMIGAYHETLQLIHDLGMAEEGLLRMPLQMDMLPITGKPLRLRTPRLPVPLNLFIALVRCKGLSLADRWYAALFGLRLFLKMFFNDSDMSVEELLRQHHQSPRLIEFFWEPLCLATLNTHLHEASAQIFLRVLNDAFMHRTNDSDLICNQVDLGRLLPDPAMDMIEKHHGHILISQRATALEIFDNTVCAVHIKGQRIPCSQVILAIPPYAACDLIAEHPALYPLHSQLRDFEYAPITTIYIQYPEQVHLAEPMLGLQGGMCQWIFDRRLTHQAGLMAVVISGDGPHMELENEVLITQVTEELAQRFPEWPKPLDHLVIREKRATFKSKVGINRLRPDNQTEVAGLWLAGDYTRTGYPATLEGAVRSGRECAQRIAQELNLSI